MSEQSSFAASMARFKARHKADAERIHRRTVAKLGDSLIDGTPEDTGHAAGNWHAAIGREDRDEIENADPTRARAQIRSIAERIEIGDEVFLTNAAPYILALEYGDAKHSPSGMMRRTLQRSGRFIREANEGG